MKRPFPDADCPLSPANHDLLGVVKGARNGIVYGCKVRFPHALVMAALFSHKPWPVRIHGILTATRNHALALGKFVTIYKLMMLIQKRLNGGKERDLDTLIAGGIGGWWVFSERTPVSTAALEAIDASHLPDLFRRSRVMAAAGTRYSDAMAFLTSSHPIADSRMPVALGWMARMRTIAPELHEIARQAQRVWCSPVIAEYYSVSGVGNADRGGYRPTHYGIHTASDEAIWLTHLQINEQIVLYIMSRVVLSFLPRLYSSSAGPSKGPLEPLSHPLPDILSPEANPRPIPPANVPFAIVATLSWGLVMYIFRHRGERLQPGIVNSMREYKL